MFRLTLEPSSGNNVSTWLKVHLCFGGVVQANVVSIMVVYTGLLCARAVCCARRDYLVVSFKMNIIRLQVLNPANLAEP